MKTADAVARFQSVNGLTADGIYASDESEDRSAIKLIKDHKNPGAAPGFIFSSSTFL